jgi:hypothetical protein
LETLDGTIRLRKPYYDTDLKADRSRFRTISQRRFGDKDSEGLQRRCLRLRKRIGVLCLPRWSITAVDSITSKELIEKVKTFPEIGEYRVYESRYLDNIFEVLMLPGRWSYEAIEAWYPWHCLESQRKKCCNVL